MHTVKWQGESLSTIAAWYTGTVRNWRILAEANPQVTDRNRLPIGEQGPHPREDVEDPRSHA